MKKAAGMLLLIGLGWTVQAQAKNANEVFESVSSSMVVVKAFDAKGKQVAFGSGVALGADEVVTNCHVLEEGKGYRVVYRSQTYPAKLKHLDWDRDVCSLAVPGLKASPAALGATGKLKVGQKVYAVGAPQGLDLSLSDGIIASLRPVAGGQYLQITAPISPGSSGGGLFDEDGLLIGLPTFYLAEGQQLNFAVPVEWIKELPKRKQTAKAEQSDTYWLSKAIALEAKEDWDGLLRHALAWSKAKPRDAGGWFALGYAYHQSGQTAKAIEAFQQGLRINPENAAAWYNLGIAYDDSGQTAKAIEAYQQAIRINPEDAAAWYNLGNAYDDSSQTAKAIEAYQQAIRINPEDAAAWYNLGIAYRKSGQTGKAIEAYQQAIRIDPEHAAAWSNLGIAYRKSGQTGKAIEAYQQAIRIDPEDAAAWYNLGIVYRKSGQTGKVMDVYKKLKTIAPDRADEFFTKIVLP